MPLRRQAGARVNPPFPRRPREIDDNEWRVVELLREVKSRQQWHGHGDVLVTIVDGVETLYEPTPRELPPLRR